MSLNRLNYLVLRPHQLPEVHRLMYQSFHRDEPMTNHLHLCQGSFSIPDSDAMAESLVIDHNLSLMALDKASNATKAVMLNGAFDRSEIDATREEVIESCVDKKFVPIASILHEVQIRGRKIFYERDIETAFDLKMLAVHPDTRGMGLAREMIQRSVALAQCLGYRMCKTEATGDYSRKAFIKAGFEVVAECDYKDFTVDGEKVFKDITGHKGVALLVKMLD